MPRRTSRSRRQRTSQILSGKEHEADDGCQGSVYREVTPLGSVADTAATDGSPGRVHKVRRGAAVAEDMLLRIAITLCSSRTVAGPSPS
jgi:hypothetical protein